MQTILDVRSLSNNIIRFVFTPAGEETLFKITRDHDLLTVINRSLPTEDQFLKEHGTLLFGDLPKVAITGRLLQESLHPKIFKITSRVSGPFRNRMI